jgi:hypothetical protein
MGQLRALRAGRGGFAVHTEFSHGLENEKGSAAAYRIGTGFLLGDAGGGLGIEAGLLRSGAVSYARTVTKDYRYNGLTLTLTAAWSL